MTFDQLFSCNYCLYKNTQDQPGLGEPVCGGGLEQLLLDCQRHPQRQQELRRHQLEDILIKPLADILIKIPTTTIAIVSVT